MDKYSAVVADTVRVNGTVAAEDVSIEFPSITNQTADIKAMGTLSLPMLGLIDDMTTTITKVGVDKGYSKMIRLEKTNLEARWVGEKVDASGKTTAVGYKAFVTGIPQEIPGISVEVGSSPESAVKYTTYRYQLFADGEEVILVDRMNQILRINGVDYMKDIRNLL